jgi:aminopeptidase N
MYPDTGNGGYTSLHTDVYLVYDATTNQFLPGNHVVLTDRATQCLSSFSLDFERTSASPDGPDMTVTSVRVNGQPAEFAFAQPAFPGDPFGPGDPRPEAHEMSQHNPVGGPTDNPLPPACSPELPSFMAEPDSQDGLQCPANKLVITPSRPIPNGAVFTVTVSYTGRPGVHNDGDGSTEGWFRAPDGGFVTTEPVGTEDWMPLNDYPTAKPTYDFYDTVNADKTAVANGVLVSVRHDPPDAELPHGAVTWHWRSVAPVASYLVEDSIGNFLLSQRTVDGIRYYQAQNASISEVQRTANLAIMNQQPDITQFESQFSGPYPFTSDGIVVDTPAASFDEEMQSMITFANGEADLSVLYHENMHQWWGDNVSEGSYGMTFYKEGLAALAQYLLVAREAEDAAGGPSSSGGQTAFDASLIQTFNALYAQGGSFWAQAPSNPTPFGLFSRGATYGRPAAAYIALRQILGSANFAAALRQIQRQYSGSSITEPQLEAAFQQWMPDRSAACQVRLGQFFAQWFDTAYPDGGSSRPEITGPGLDGPDFYNASRGCG